ncbi:sialic acid-binding Ig-like lectin 7 [Mugil cephalus]|uniref:sialic acid-binding Ig-like lectin 7 n=1 Tax=Mugil cephalus TaxID=48193 RepID=UPI001FB610DC|nr:sialic acid-binding Ig-like lectin 7 [Mugil cephalus]
METTSGTEDCQKKMIFIYVILCLHVMVSHCQPQCAKETPDDKDFSLNVTEHVAVESGECIRISYELTFLTSKVSAPYTKTWFRQDNSNTLYKAFVSEVKSESEASFTIRGLPRGEYEYGFKLEWGCNQTYVFPKKVHISVSASTQKPTVRVPPMKEGDVIGLKCRPPHFCSKITNVYWKWTQTDGQSEVLQRDFYTTSHHDYDHYYSRRPFHPLSRRENLLRFLPTAYHHNTNITCVVEYDDGAVETTVTMTVKFPPKILPGSQCIFKGKLLVCECISRGNPHATDHLAFGSTHRLLSHQL